MVFRLYSLLQNKSMESSDTIIVDDVNFWFCEQSVPSTKRRNSSLRFTIRLMTLACTWTRRSAFSTPSTTTLNSKSVIVSLPSYLLWSHPTVLLKAAPLSARQLMESVLTLARILPLACDCLLSPVPPSGIAYPIMSAFRSPRLSFALNSELTSSALPMDSNDFPASICICELCKEVTIK